MSTQWDQNHFSILPTWLLSHPTQPPLITQLSGHRDTEGMPIHFTPQTITPHVIGGYAGMTVFHNNDINKDFSEPLSCYSRATQTTTLPPGKQKSEAILSKFITTPIPYAPEMKKFFLCPCKVSLRIQNFAPTMNPLFTTLNTFDQRQILFKQTFKEEVIYKQWTAQKLWFDKLVRTSSALATKLP